MESLFLFFSEPRLKTFEPKGGPKNYYMHSALMSNQTKVWKTKIGPLQGDKAWSIDPKSALFEIQHNKEHFY